MNYHQFISLVIGFILGLFAILGLFLWEERSGSRRSPKRLLRDVTSELAHRPIQDEVMDVKMGELL